MPSRSDVLIEFEAEHRIVEPAIRGFHGSMYADDLRLDSLGVAGNPVIRTPHIDKLAGEGVFFRGNCVTTSVCGVSRALPGAQ